MPHYAPHHRPVLGIAMKLLSVVLLSSMAAGVKYLGPTLPVGQLVFFRGLISVLVLAAIAWWTSGFTQLRTHNWRSHAVRSLAWTISMFGWFLGLTLLPFADMTVITFTAPMFLTVLAMVFLGERIHRFRWTALALGFAGVLVMIGPHLRFGSGSSFGVLVGLGAAVCAAFALMFLRSMSGGGGEHAITITFYFMLTSMVCAAFTALWGWPMPTLREWGVVVLMGLFGAFGQLAMTFSYRYAEASTIAPLDYTSLLMAVAYGYFVFGEVPRLSVWVGAPLVIAAGLIILWREYRLASAAGMPGAPPAPEASGT